MATLSAAYFQFFEQLAQNNHSAWFQENKKTYEKEVKAPFTALVAALLKEVKLQNPNVLIEAKDTLFRINRDIRFSTDKRPYKEHMAAYIPLQGANKKVQPGFFMSFGPAECFIGGGLYELDKEQLHKVRSEIFYQPEQFNALITEPSFVKLYGTVQGEKNKVLPEPFKAAVAQQPLLAHKQFYVSHIFGQAEAQAPDLVARLVQLYQVALPLNQFLQQAIAPAE